MPRMKSTKRSTNKATAAAIALDPQERERAERLIAGLGAGGNGSVPQT